MGAAKGCLIAIVGPSGSGKDSLLAAVREHYADNQDVKVVQRVITRPSDAGHEPHQYLSNEDFIAARDSCLLYTSPSPRDATLSRMPSSA